MRNRDVRILDQFARQKRTDKFIESLDRDNFHSDKEDVLVQMFEDLEKERALRAAERKCRNSKTIKYNFIVDGDCPIKRPRLDEKKKKAKTVRGDHFKTRFRKTFEILMAEEEQRLKSGSKLALIISTIT